MTRTLGQRRCGTGDCNRPYSHKVTHYTVEGVKIRGYCRRHRELVLRSPNARPGVPDDEDDLTEQTKQ